MYDLKITNARLRGRGDERFTIGIEDKRIAAIAPALDQPSAQQLDAGGNLVTESFVNGHLHLCKVYTLERAGQKALEEYQQDGMSHPALDHRECPQGLRPGGPARRDPHPGLCRCGQQG